MGQVSHEAGPYNMTGLAQALPQYQSQSFAYGPQSFSQQYPPHGRTDQPMPYQSLQGSQFAGQGAVANPSFNPQILQQYSNQMSQPQLFRPGGHNFMTTQATRTLPTGPAPYMEQHIFSQQQTQPQYQSQYHQGYTSQYPQPSSGFPPGAGRGQNYILNPTQSLPYGSGHPQPLTISPIDTFSGQSPMRHPGGYQGAFESKYTISNRSKTVQP